MNERPSRTYALSSPVPLRCSICRRPVELVAGNGHACFLDPPEPGEHFKRPHACPEEAVHQFMRQQALRRLGARREHSERTVPHRTGRSGADS